MRLAIALLCLAQVVQPGAAAAAEPRDDPMAAPARDLERVEQRIRTLEQDLAARKGQRKSIGDELERCDRDIADLARAGRELESLLAGERKVEADLRRRLSAGEMRLAHERDGLAKLIRAAYVAGRGGGLRLLLDREDAFRTDRVMAYYGYLNRERRRRIAEVTDQAKALEVLAGDAVQEAERLAGLMARQDEMRRKLMAASEERSALLAELDRDIAAGRRDMAALSADAQGLRRVIAQLARQAQIVAEADLQPSPLAEHRGRLPWPLPGAALVVRFGEPKDAEGQRWDGVVLAAEEGSEVQAVYAGRVVYADWLRGYGLLLIIDHGDGYMSLYGNNQTLLKEVGEWVAAGDVVALSGSSGGQQMGQLYFAIRRDGEPQDPLAWCGAVPAPG